LGAFDIARLHELLPHRYPFLMIDRIVDVDGENSAVGIKNVTANEPHFAGHFPGRPIMPGVLLVEGMAQTAAAICIANSSTTVRPEVYFMTIEECKFRKPVVPGDVVAFHVQRLRNRRNIWKFKGEAIVDGGKVAQAIFSAMLVNG
jgi:3-hydroxyacyl-[acyl-carrier-protein] dehydratase